MQYVYKSGLVCKISWIVYICGLYATPLATTWRGYELPITVKLFNQWISEPVQMFNCLSVDLLLVLHFHPGFTECVLLSFAFDGMFYCSICNFLYYETNGVFYIVMCFSTMMWPCVVVLGYCDNVTWCIVVLEQSCGEGLTVVEDVWIPLVVSVGLEGLSTAGISKIAKSVIIPLADFKVSVYCLSTYKTDYVLVSIYNNRYCTRYVEVTMYCTRYVEVLWALLPF